EPMRQVRLRLAACRLIQQEKTASDLPGGRWNISPSRHIGGLALLDLNNSHSDLSSNLNLRVPRVLWPMTDHEKMKKQVDEDLINLFFSSYGLVSQMIVSFSAAAVSVLAASPSGHEHRTGAGEGEQTTQETPEEDCKEEEMKLERARMLAEAKQRLEERELLILERLKLEEEGAMQLQRRNREEKGNNSARDNIIHRLYLLILAGSRGEGTTRPRGPVPFSRGQRTRGGVPMKRNLLFLFSIPQLVEFRLYRGFILFLTFLFYTAYHLSRKPISIVKVIFCVSSGIFGERLPLRYYLSFGMLTSGLFTCLFGLGYYWNIHSLGYYAFIQLFVHQIVQENGETEPLLQNGNGSINGAISTETPEIVEEHSEAISFFGALRIPVSRQKQLHFNC
ncbi:hypothetical protein XENOCAPTIV_027215, partial [Xenoophorus captivus]